MNQSITILEALIIAVVCIFGYVFIKTLVQTIKNK
jgi:hypothetical protein